MTKATMLLVYNAIGIYASGHALYNEVDLYCFFFPNNVKSNIELVLKEVN